MDRGLHRPTWGVLFWLIVLSPLWSIGAAAWAQGRAGGLTLEEALRLARRHNPELRQARNGMRMAAASERRRWGAFLPELRTEASLSEFTSRTLTARNEFGQPVTLDTPTSFTAAAASAGLSASLTLFDGYRGVNLLRAARAGSAAAADRHGAEWVRVEAEVRRRFYTALGARRLVEVEERLLDAAEGRLSAMREMVRAGRATGQDVLGAEVDVARQRMALEDARAEAYAARLRLQEVIGVGEEAGGAVVGEFPEPVDPEGLDADSLVRVALRAHPRVRRARWRLKQAERSAAAARAVRLPSVRVAAGLDRAISLSRIDQLPDFPWNRGLGVGLYVSLPLFTGFEASEEVTRASVEEANAEEELRQVRLSAENEVRSALARTRAAYRSVRLAARAAELSRRRLEVAQEGFRGGIVSFTELQQLIDRAALAERTGVYARMEYARALATLGEAVGRTEEWAGKGEDE